MIFDLDNTLAEARGVGEKTFAPAFDAIRRANDGHLDAEALEASLQECWHTAFFEVARKHGYSDAMTRAGAEAFSKLRVPPDSGYQGYADMALLKELPLPCHLVTSGFTGFQHSKIDALGIRDAFASIHVDDPTRNREGEITGKAPVFERIRLEAGLEPGQVVVVGDNPHSEIRAGRQLNMPTVQMLRPGVSASTDADFRIRDLSELPRVLAMAHASADDAMAAGHTEDATHGQGPTA